MEDRQWLCCFDFSLQLNKSEHNTSDVCGETHKLMHVWLNCPGYTQIHRGKGSDGFKIYPIPSAVAASTKEQFLTCVSNILDSYCLTSWWKVEKKKPTSLWPADGILMIPWRKQNDFLSLRLLLRPNHHPLDNCRSSNRFKFEFPLTICFIGTAQIFPKWKPNHSSALFTILPWPPLSLG